MNWLITSLPFSWPQFGSAHLCKWVWRTCLCMKTHFVITRQINSLNLAESFLSLMFRIVPNGAWSALTVVSVDCWTWTLVSRKSDDLWNVTGKRHWYVTGKCGDINVKNISSAVKISALCMPPNEPTAALISLADYCMAKLDIIIPQAVVEEVTLFT